MLQGHSSHNVLKDLLHDFDELGVELGHGRSSRWPSTTAGSAILNMAFTAAAVESTIRDGSFSTELGCLRHVWFGSDMPVCLNLPQVPGSKPAPAVLSA